MKNPGRDYPMAIILLMVAAIVLSSIGGLSVAAVIPHAEINLSAGVMQAFEVLIGRFGPGVEWTIRGIATLLMLGVLAEVAAWIVGPSRGMLVTAQHGLLPKALSRVNKNGVPVALVISQLLITTVALIVFTNTGGGNNISFMIAMSLTVVIYLCSYFMLFLGYIHLVCKQPEKKRAFTVPGGKTFKLLIAGMGFLVSLFAFVISFVPPSSLPGAHGLDVYVSSLLVSFLLVAAIPFILYAVHDKQGHKLNAELEHIKPHTIHSDHFFIHPRARSTHHVIVDGVNTTHS